MLLVRKSSAIQRKSCTNTVNTPTELSRLTLKFSRAVVNHLLTLICRWAPNWILWARALITFEISRITQKENRKVVVTVMPRLKLSSRLKKEVPFRWLITWARFTWKERGIGNKSFDILQMRNSYFFHDYRHSLLQPVFMQIKRFTAYKHVDGLRLEPFFVRLV